MPKRQSRIDVEDTIDMKGEERPVALPHRHIAERFVDVALPDVRTSGQSLGKVNCRRQLEMWRLSVGIDVGWFWVSEVMDHPPLHSGSKASKSTKTGPICRWPTLKVVESRAFQKRPMLIRETFKGTTCFKRLEARCHPHCTQVQQRRVGRRRQGNVAAVIDFLLHYVLHALEVQIKHRVVGNADAIVYNVLQREGHTIT